MDNQINLFEVVTHLKQDTAILRTKLATVLETFTGPVATQGGPKPVQNPTIWGEFETITQDLQNLNVIADRLSSYVGANAFAKNAAYGGPEKYAAGGIRG